MDKFEHRTLKTEPHGLTYSYYVSPNFNASLNPKIPTLMLVHGYPDHAYMWEGAVPILMQLPYPILIPDLLGFGGSDKPAESHYYNYKKQASSLNQILDHEKVPNNVIPIGHDWGSATSQRFYLYHRNRCVGLAILSLAYQIPSAEPFDLEKTNAATEKRFGYPQWEYWNFFCRPDAPELMSKNPGRFFDVNHGYYPSPDPKENGHDIWMREMFCTPNRMYEYVTGTGKYKDYEVTLKHHARKNPEMKKQFIERMTRDGFVGPVNYYHSLRDNTMLDDEKELCDKSGGKDLRKIEVPMLYIGQTGDWVCRVDLMQDAVKEGLVNDLEEKVVNAGHWVLQEKPEEIADIIKDWLLRRFPVQK